MKSTSSQGWMNNNFKENLRAAGYKTDISDEMECLKQEKGEFELVFLLNEWI